MDRLPDECEALIAEGALDALFERLDRAITAAGYLPRGGQILDGEPLSRHRSERRWRTLVAAPRQRNTDGEKAQIKAGRTAAEIWPDEPFKARQKDVPSRQIASQSPAGQWMAAGR